MVRNVLAVSSTLGGHAQVVPTVYIDNNTWAPGDMELLFESSTRYLLSERSERVRTREEKFHISQQTCIILFVIQTSNQHGKADLIHDLKGNALPFIHGTK